MDIGSLSRRHGIVLTACAAGISLISLIVVLRLALRGTEEPQVKAGPASFAVELSSATPGDEITPSSEHAAHFAKGAPVGGATTRPPREMLPPTIGDLREERDQVFSRPDETQSSGPVTLEARRQRFLDYIAQLRAIREAMMENERRPVTITGTKAKLLASPPKAAGPIADGEAADRWSGPYGGAHDTGTQSIRDEAAWRTFWTWLSQDPMPRLDFTRVQVAAVFLGPRPTAGYAVEILDVKTSETAVTVRWREISPAAGTAPLETPTSPFAALTIPRSSLPVRFKKIK